MKCNECGSEMLETDKFCGICGTPNSLIQRETAEPVQEQEPPVREQEPYEQEPAEAETAAAAEVTEESEKVKRTCSLSAVVFCIVVIFLLSVACGAFAGLYLSARSAAVTAPYSITQSYSGGES